ncbi:helix-hairpin-helix domain-containing protein, partial [Chloroflexota bacterium]
GVLFFLLPPVAETPSIDTTQIDRSISDVDTKAKLLDERLNALEAKAKHARPERIATAEDLQIIEGIGPKIGETLVRGGFDSFDKIAEADIGQLWDTVSSAGITFAPSLRTWPGQAEYIVRGDIIGFEKHTAELIGGRDSSMLPEDLTMVEGIGPKIKDALVAARIDTFGKLALAKEERLRDAIKAAGINFAPSLPSWSKQAEMILRGDVVAFEQYKDALDAGREKK